jgi:hypothetical protein
VFNASKFDKALTAKFVDQPPILPPEYRNVMVGVAIPAMVTKVIVLEEAQPSAHTILVF